MTKDELEKRKRELADRVVALAKQQLLAHAYFFAQALGKLRVEYRELGTPFATDGRTLFVDADVVLGEYARTRKPPVHDLTHVLLHCLLLHPFVKGASDLDYDAWQLASDIEAERLTAELLGPREGPRGEALNVIVQTLEREIGGSLSTETIYRALTEGKFTGKRAAWKKVVGVDDSTWWFDQRRRLRRGKGEASESPDASQASHGGGGSHSSPASRSLKSPAESDRGVPEENAARRPSHSNKTRTPSAGSKGEGQERSFGSREFQEAYDDRATEGDLDPSTEDLRREWRRAARSVHLDLETLSHEQGRSLHELTHALEISGTPQTSLADFLRQFGTYHEVLHVSPDEFDYVFYTYGLKLFGNMPLIENLEVSEQRRVHDFAIVLDTSASVEGATVKAFVEEAFGVLSAQNLYCDRVNVHVIQCDAQVRDDVTLTSKADVERWKSHVVLHGFGGTDFRPAFDYVDKLVEQGKLSNLVGLIYFTDGWGTYPVRPPGYRVAFVFYDSNHPHDAVPPWAMQLELSRAQLDERGVHEH